MNHINKLDSFDYKILNAVQANNRVTSAELAKKVGLSSSACQRRLNSMRKVGIIEKAGSTQDILCLRVNLDGSLFRRLSKHRLDQRVT